MPTGKLVKTTGAERRPIRGGGAAEWAQPAARVSDLALLRGALPKASSAASPGVGMRAA